MRGALSVIIIALFAGCVQAQSPSPGSRLRVEGDISLVSAADIRSVLVVARREIQKTDPTAKPIDEIRIEAPNRIAVFYWTHDGFPLGLELKKIAGRWRTVPTERVIRRGTPCGLTKR